MTSAIITENVQRLDASRLRKRRRALALVLTGLVIVIAVAGLAAGSDGWSILAFIRLLQTDDAGLIIGQIRAPRTLGAMLVGALLGLGGALSQAMFRNPLADPYLLGSASGASLAVILILAAGSASAGLLPSGFWATAAGFLSSFGLVTAAFFGAWAGVGLTLTLSRGARSSLSLLLAGVVVGVLLGAIADFAATLAPEILRNRQAFLLGSTSLLSWSSCAWLALGLWVIAVVNLRLARALDALGLGEESAESLGLPVKRLRMIWVLSMAVCTGLAVSQAGLVAFVGLAAPHLVRRFVQAPHAFSLPASAASGAVLLGSADLLARTLWAPSELPVGILTAVLGGCYLLWLLHRGYAKA